MFNIEEFSLFSELDSEFVKKIKKEIIVKQYAKDSIVFYEGDKSQYLHILLEGSVRLFRTSPRGTQIHIHALSAPSLVAESPTLDKKDFPATCEFITNGKMGLLHFDKLFEYMQDPLFSLKLVSSLTKKVHILSMQLYKETILSAEAKVVDLILREPTIYNRLKNSEIAAILNLTPETFSRVLSKLKKENIVSVSDQKLVIEDKDALHKILETNRLP